MVLAKKKLKQKTKKRSSKFCFRIFFNYKLYLYSSPNANCLHFRVGVDNQAAMSCKLGNVAEAAIIRNFDTGIVCTSGICDNLLILVTIDSSTFFVVGNDDRY